MAIFQIISKNIPFRFLHVSCTKFLLNNNKLIFLYDETGTVYETPEVGYYGNYYKKIGNAMKYTDKQNNWIQFICIFHKSNIFIQNWPILNQR